MKGEEFHLSTEIGTGGEGKVFAIRNHREMAAKIYNWPPDSDKSLKLKTMISKGTKQLHQLSAWPIDMLKTKQHGRIVGFIMPRINDYKPIHLLYRPKDRLEHFINADWRFLIHVAINLSSAFANIHSHTHIIGDVNPNNILVSKDGTVKFIDCDSFQIYSKGKYLTSNVGVPEYTPAELQGVDLKGRVRTENHDNFGLAVIIFQLLFMGRHPYASGYMSPDQSIKEGRFVYSRYETNASSPSNNNFLTLTDITELAARLFEKAFLYSPVVKGINRPNGIEWRDALIRMSKHLQICNNHINHYYLRNRTRCPWCKIERQTSTILFPSPANRQNSQNRKFNIDETWSKICAVGPPESLNLLNNVTISETVLNLQHALQVKRNYLITAGAILCIIIMSITTFHIAWVMLLSSIVFVIYWLIRTTLGWLHLTSTRNNIAIIKDQLDSLYDDWKSKIDDKKHIELLQELTNLKFDYLQLPNLKNDKISHVEKLIRNDLIERYLSQYSILEANIEGLSIEEALLLKDHKIITAKDITKTKLEKIPFANAKNRLRLLNWRTFLEKHSTIIIPDALLKNEIYKIDQEISNLKRIIERDLEYGLIRLQEIKREITTSRIQYKMAVEKPYNQLHQLYNDEKVLLRLCPQFTHGLLTGHGLSRVWLF